MDFGDNGGVQKDNADTSLFRLKKLDENYYLKSREQILWHFVDPNFIARLYGFTLQGLSGEDAKEMLRERKVWPFYYPHPQNPLDLDRYPTELALDKTISFRGSKEKTKNNSHGKKAILRNSEADRISMKKSKKSRKIKHPKRKKNNILIGFFKRLKFGK